MVERRKTNSCLGSHCREKRSSTYNRVSTATASRLDHCFTTLESEPLNGPGIKHLQGATGTYRCRVGGLRVIYEVDTDKQIVYVMAILPRGQAYR